jgi:hypothetical protein
MDPRIRIKNENLWEDPQHLSGFSLSSSETVKFPIILPKERQIRKGQYTSFQTISDRRIPVSIVVDPDPHHFVWEAAP